MRRRTIWILASVALVVLAITAAVELRRRAAPEPARLLPEADAYVYLNLSPLRKLGLIGASTLPMDDPDYQAFVRETGFQFERDLEEAAFAVHPAPGLVDAEPAPNQAKPFRRYSEVFRGHFDSHRADTYFRKIAKSVEEYREVSVYDIPLEGRTVRVALLGVGLVAVSNTDGPQAMHFMIDRYKELALPFGGPSLVREYYRRVPLGSLVWGITRVNARSAKATSLLLPQGFDLLFPNNSVVVGSARYTTAVSLKAEAFTSSPETAKQVVEQANGFLTIFRSLEGSLNPSGPDPDVKAFFESLKVEQNKSRAVLTASLTPEFLKKLFAQTPSRDIAGEGVAEQEQQPPAKKPEPKRK